LPNSTLHRLAACCVTAVSPGHGRPSCPRTRICRSATNPKISPNRTPPRIPKISEVIAKPFVVIAGAGGK